MVGTFEVQTGLRCPVISIFVFLYLLLQFLLAGKHLSAIQDLSVFAVRTLDLSILPWRIRSRPSDLHPQVLCNLLESPFLFCLLFVVYELCSIIHLDYLDRKTHSILQTYQELSCLIGALFFYDL